jgi:vancomycin resistance protein YoaR
MFAKEMKEKNKKILKWLLYSVAVFFIAGGLLSALFLYLESKYEDKIYPGVRIINIDVGGMGKDTAGKILMDRVDKMSQRGVEFAYKDTKITLTPTVSSFSPDLAYPVYSFDIEKTIDKAYNIGRENDPWGNLIKKIATYVQGEDVDVVYNLRAEEAKTILKDSFAGYEDPAVNARLQIKEEGEEEGMSITVTPEKAGEVIDYDKALDDLGQRLKKLNPDSSVRLTIKKQEPQIYEKDCQGIEGKVKEVLDKAPLILKDKTATTTENKDAQEWEVNKKQLAAWLTLEKAGEEVKIALNKKEIESYLQENISPETDQDPIDARFTVENGKVSEFRDSKPGKKLNIQKTTDNIADSVLRGKGEIAALETEVLESEYTTQKVNDLGIDEIIGTGHSNFSGSPANRIHNINVGANSVKGLLIEPGEEFSLNQALGEVNRESGYLPELVIKGNKTIPEYGGGLCQIGTTVFRAALRSGLTITERQNHSYRVSYYEPPVGMDATIYKPHPDLRFKNDTDNHILIQARVEGYDLYFDFWGADDGRTVEISDPVVYGITAPQEPEMIETAELKPGEQKCTESAHNGASAYFDYKVNYNNEEKENKERRFYSHYKPWRKRCLIGAEEKDPEGQEEAAIDTNATSTREQEEE